MRVDTCVDQTHLGHSCYQGIQGPVESSFSIENSFQLIHIVTQNYVWVEMNSLLKMMIWLVPVSLGNRHRKMTPPVKQQKCRLFHHVVQERNLYFTMLCTFWTFCPWCANVYGGFSKSSNLFSQNEYTYEKRQVVRKGCC